MGQSFVSLPCTCDLFRFPCSSVISCILPHVKVSTCNPPVCRVFAQIRPFSKADFIRMPVVVASGFGGKQTTQSAYMLSTPWAAGSPHVRSHFCLMMCLLWCLYRNNLIPGRLCVLGALEAMQRKHLGGAKCAQWPSHPQNPIERGGDMLMLITLLKCTQEF